MVGWVGGKLYSEVENLYIVSISFMGVVCTAGVFHAYVSFYRKRASDLVHKIIFSLLGVLYDVLTYDLFC